MRSLVYILFFAALLTGCKSENKKEDTLATEETVVTQEKGLISAAESIEIKPISHATAVLDWGDHTIYIDPVGGAESFKDMEKASLVLVTDIHGDHMDAETLQALDLSEASIVAPQAVKEKLPTSLQEKLVVLSNGESLTHEGLTIEAIPMYNLREEAKQFHPKGRGNGYLLEENGKRVYIAGDTEDIPEMRNLQDIDIALVPMNLPYTMTVEKAADAVLDFAPRKVYPYHFRGKEGKSDVDKFKQLVQEGNKEIEVVIADWYPSDKE